MKTIREHKETRNNLLPNEKGASKRYLFFIDEILKAFKIKDRTKRLAKIRQLKHKELTYLGNTVKFFDQNTKRPFSINTLNAYLLAYRNHLKPLFNKYTLIENLKIKLDLEHKKEKQLKKYNKKTEQFYESIEKEIDQLEDLNFLEGFKALEILKNIFITYYDEKPSHKVFNKYISQFFIGQVNKRKSSSLLLKNFFIIKEFKEQSRAQTKKIVEYNERSRKALNFKDIKNICLKLLHSHNYKALLLGLLLVTGRRPFELLYKGKFSKREDNEIDQQFYSSLYKNIISFSGQAKTKEKNYSYNIPLLFDYDLESLNNNIQKIRTYFPLKNFNKRIIDEAGLYKEFNNKYSNKINMAFHAIFKVDSKENIHLIPYDLRKIYSVTCLEWAKRKEKKQKKNFKDFDAISETSFYQKILGHSDTIITKNYNAFYYSRNKKKIFKNLEKNLEEFENLEKEKKSKKLDFTNLNHLTDHDINQILKTNEYQKSYPKRTVFHIIYQLIKSNNDFKLKDIKEHYYKITKTSINRNTVKSVLEKFQ